MGSHDLLCITSIGTFEVSINPKDETVDDVVKRILAEGLDFWNDGKLESHVDGCDIKFYIPYLAI